MIKTKVFKLSSGHRQFANSLEPVADYSYCIYLFGYLIHSVTLHDISKEAAKCIFNGKEVDNKKHKNESAKPH